MRCPSCRLEAPRDALYCPACGERIRGESGTVTTGDVSGTGIAIGHRAQAAVTQGLSGAEITRLFEPIYESIERRPEDPNVDKDELADTVQRVQEEASKGEEANSNKIERWLKMLADFAPDVLDVTVAALTNPVSGVAAAVRKVAERLRAQRAGA